MNEILRFALQHEIIDSFYLISAWSRGLSNEDVLVEVKERLAKKGRNFFV